MDEQSIQNDYTFRGVEYTVRMTVCGELLEVEVEDKITSDQWRGEFDSAFIEDVTHKTGNFKQFSIFCNMLESAINKISESVTLDLLTYNDLELLRNRKIGVNSRHIPASKSSALNTKRYLILIYSVEFDRIHYPLPLPYVGKPDPAVLQKVIRELKEELSALKSRQGKDYRDAEIRRLRAELEKITQEKQDLEVTFLHLQDEVKLSKKNSALKEVKILKKIVQSLEEELIKERTKHQRSTSKRSQEYSQVIDELEEVKASERNLKIRVKSLTNELVLYKKGRLTPVGPSPQCRSNSALNAGQPSQTRTNSARKRKDDRRSSSQDRSGLWSDTRERSVSRERNGHWSTGRERSSSRESRSGSQPRIPMQSPSPAGTRAPRFDPTAYVKDKQRKQKDVKQKITRKIERDIRCSPASTERGRSNSRRAKPIRGRRHTGLKRNSSVESGKSRRSSASSTSEFEDLSEPARLSEGQRERRAGRVLGTNLWHNPNMCRNDATSRKRISSTPTKSRQANKENLFDPSADLSEIDARLQALQEYMKTLDTRT
ncbi:centrosomal protein CCDC61 isoform X2 [Protopterus annectens]|uniref:centrosomal protein CCDC61 isoform X2 n=1 Tax=Protopterus annectens TaxID=7888 RepID=UPI001CF93D37|nr:centrosomal protein CCDC61 isoform X2 [Protopterus annectens]